MANSEPAPRPPLVADTLPPCSSTRLRTIARPRPRPPRDRSSVCGCCTKRSKIRGSMSGSMPLPVSATRSTTSPPSAAAVTEIAPPGSVYFAAFVSRFDTTCARRAASPSTINPCAGHVDTQIVALLLEQRARHLDRARDDVGDLDGLAPQLDLAARDPRHVEQVVDEARPGAAPGAR